MSDPVGYSGPDFAALEFKDPPFVVDKLFPYGGVGLIYGKRNAGKSVLALTMAKTIINGEPWANRYKTAGSKVAYISTDMPVQQVQDRIVRFLPEVRVPENFMVFVTDSPVDLMAKSTPRKRWVEQMREFDPDLIWLDSLHKIHCMSENDSNSVSILYRRLPDLFGDRAHIGLLHHEHKPGEASKGRGLEDKARGSGSWLDDSDVGYHVLRHGTNATVTLTRWRFCEAQLPIKFSFNKDTLLFDLAQDKEKTSRERALEIMVQMPDISKHDLANQLQLEGVCGQSRAYTVAGEVIKEMRAE
jgi:RecA-family ATPase